MSVSAFLPFVGAAAKSFAVFAVAAIKDVSTAALNQTKAHESTRDQMVADMQGAFVGPPPPAA